MKNTIKTHLRIFLCSFLFLFTFSPLSFSNVVKKHSVFKVPSVPIHIYWSLSESTPTGFADCNMNLWEVDDNNTPIQRFDPYSNSEGNFDLSFFDARPTYNGSRTNRIGVTVYSLAGIYPWSGSHAMYLQITGEYSDGRVETLCSLSTDIQNNSLYFVVGPYLSNNPPNTPETKAIPDHPTTITIRAFTL